MHSKFLQLCLCTNQICKKVYMLLSAAYRLYGNAFHILSVSSDVLRLLVLAEGSSKLSSAHNAII